MHILDKKTLTDPAAVRVLFHDQKQIILRLLIEKEMNIINLKNAIKMNPGTIKRHLNDLVDTGLAVISRIEKNVYGVTMKFYRATARKYIFDIEWPKEDE